MIEKIVGFGEHQLVGVLHQPSRRTSACVVTCHGLYGNKDGQKYVEIAHKFYQEGVAVLRFDFTGCGESKGRFEDSTLSRRIDDLRSALDLVEQRRYEDIGVMGSSLGGCVSVLTAAEDDRIKALSTWATPCYLNKIFSREAFPKLWEDIKEYEVAQVLREVKRPILIIHGSLDEQVPLSHAHALYEEANEPKRLEVIEGANHRFTDPTYRGRAVDLTVNWLKIYLK